jgi:putative transposase
MHQGLKRDYVLAVCGMSKHQFYYQPSGRKRGRKPSKVTMKQCGKAIIELPNSAVLNDIRSILADPQADNGYRRIWGQLTLDGYYINRKKVYRLMKQARLLQPKVKGASKDYVKYRVVCPEEPLRLMEMDIKMVWLEGLRRYGYVLTIIDVFTRVVLHWDLGLQMRQKDVERCWKVVIEEHLQPHAALGWETNIEVRSDNGPQFCATDLQEFFKTNYLMRTFTHPYTPQENGHIESFHAILGRNLQGKSFDNLKELRNELDQFYPFYNDRRIHGSTLNLPPMTFWKLWNDNKIDREVIDEKKRKVKFSLKIKRQKISLLITSENESQRLLLAQNTAT